MLDRWIEKVKRQSIPGFIWIEIWSRPVVERGLDFSSVVRMIQELNAIPEPTPSCASSYFVRLHSDTAS